MIILGGGGGCGEENRLCRGSRGAAGAAAGGCVAGQRLGLTQQHVFYHEGFAGSKDFPTAQLFSTSF